MGWLYMQSLGGHSGPRQYLDAQFTYQRPEVTSKVLRSTLLKMRVYYAAIEHVFPNSCDRQIWGLVCLVKYNSRDRDGYILGYKDIDETMGPCECDCPDSILSLLSPTDNQYALEWRSRCRENATTRAQRASKPSPRPGQTILFDTSISFTDGRRLDRFAVVVNPRNNRTVLFRDPNSGSTYRIHNIKQRTYRLIDPPSA